MKRCSLVIILFALGSLGPIAQADDDVLPIKQFERVYDGPSPLANGARGMTPARDGGFFLVVVGDGKFSAVKTDRNGYIEWQKDVQYGPSGGPVRRYAMRMADSVKQAPDGGFIIGGEMAPGVSNPAGTDPSDGFLIRLDAQGNKVWDVAIGTPDFDRIAPVEVAPDGGFVAAGRTYFPSASALLAKVGDNGQLLWQKSYEAGGRWIEDLTVTHGNDGYVLGGGMLLKTDLQGNLLQSRAFDASQFVYIYRVLRAPGGGYVAAGAASQQSWILSVSKFDDSLNTEWSRTYSTHTGNWSLERRSV